MLGEVLEAQERCQSLLSCATHVAVKEWAFDKRVSEPVLGPFQRQGRHF